MTMLAPVAVELGWLLVGNSGVLPDRPEVVLEDYRGPRRRRRRGRGDRHAVRRASDVPAGALDGVIGDVATARARTPDSVVGDWEAQVDLAWIVGLLLRGWRKGLDAEAGATLGSGVAAADDLAWWCAQATEAADAPPVGGGSGSAPRGRGAGRSSSVARTATAVTRASTTRSPASGNPARIGLRVEVVEERVRLEAPGVRPERAEDLEEVRDEDDGEADARAPACRRSNETEASSAIAPNAQYSSAPFSHRSGSWPIPSSAVRPDEARPDERPRAIDRERLAIATNSAPATASVA